MKNDQDKILRIAWWVLALAVFSLTTAVRIRLLGIPLERDEGEYAYAGQLLLQGIPPYKLAYSMKFPGTYVAYAITMFLFGQTISAIHLGLLFVNSATSALIFFIGKRLVNSTVGIVAAASYALLSLSPSVFGLAGHATHFVVLPVLGGALLLLNQRNRLGAGRLFLSGLLMGLGLLMKQPGLFFVLFGATYLFLNDVRAGLLLRNVILRHLVFVGGAATPLAITFLTLFYAGVFPKFWFWTIHYAHEYGTLISISDASPDLYLSCQGRDRTKLAALDTGWNRVAHLSLEQVSQAEHRFPSWIVRFLNIGTLRRLLFSITLLYSTSACRRAVRRRSNQQHFKRFDRQITAVRFFPLLLLASCAAFLVFAQRDLFFPPFSS